MKVVAKRRDRSLRSTAMVDDGVRVFRQTLHRMPIVF